MLALDVGMPLDAHIVRWVEEPAVNLAIGSNHHTKKRPIPRISAADTIGDEVAIAREGLVTALVGQRPFEMGYKAPSVMLDLIAGKAVDDPVFTGLDECTKDTVDTCIQK